MASQRPGAVPGIRTVRMARYALPPRAETGTWEWSEMQTLVSGFLILTLMRAFNNQLISHRLEINCKMDGGGWVDADEIQGGKTCLCQALSSRISP